MILGSTTIESSPDGTGNIGGIINGNWFSINEMFNPASGLTASQSGTTVTASAAIFTADMATSNAVITWGDTSTAIITAFISATQVTVNVSQTVTSQTFEVYVSSNVLYTALARGLLKKVNFASTDDFKQVRWSQSLNRFILYGGFTTLTYTSTITLDLSIGGLMTVSLTGNVTFITSNRVAGYSMTVRIKGDSVSRNFTWPAWTWMGTAPASIAANKSAILKLNVFGTNLTDVIAEYAVQT